MSEVILMGYIYHETSKKLVHPKGGSTRPGNNTRLVIHGSKDNPACLQVRFVPQDGPYGFIEHVGSGMIVHPSGGKPNPSNNTALVYHSDRHDGALFKLDPEKKQIVHKGGKIWHPSGGSMWPSDNTGCVLHASVHNAASFYIGDIDGTPLTPYVEAVASQPATGPVGYIYHQASRKIVQPRGGHSNFGKDTQLVLHSSKQDNSVLQMRFVPVDGGPYGYIEHVANGRIVHPSGGKTNPSNNTVLVFHSDRHDGALFRFDEENQHIVHKDGKVWHPKGGLLSPLNNTTCILSSDKHQAAKFYFGDVNGKPITPLRQEKAQFKGDWRVVKAYIDPRADHSYSCSYKTGKIQTMSSTNDHDWNIESRIAYGYFKSNVDYSRYVERASSQTWSEEREETHTIHVRGGRKVVVWQYVFAVVQYGKEWSFQSNIIADTDSMDTKPELA